MVHRSTAVRGRGGPPPPWESSCRTRTGPVEADGTVDAQNAPTAPWKTLRVFHELPQGLSHRITHAKPRKAPKWRWETRIDPGSRLTDRRQGGASSSHAWRGHHVSRPPTPGELVLADLGGGQRGGSRPGLRSRERPAAADAAVVGVATAATPPDAPAPRVPRSRAGSYLWPVREPRRTGGRCPATAAPGRVPVPGGRAPLCGGASYEAEG